MNSEKNKTSNEELVKILNPEKIANIKKDIYKGLVDGLYIKDIKQYIINTYLINATQAQKIVASVKEELGKGSDEKQEVIKGLYIEMYTDLFRLAKEEEQYGTAKQILDSIVKMQGLFTDKKEVKVIDVFDIKF